MGACSVATFISAADLRAEKHLAMGEGTTEGDLPVVSPMLSPKDNAPGDDSESEEDGDESGHRFTTEETIVIFDWDDTVMPSSWVQDQGIRLDEGSVPTLEQQE